MEREEFELYFGKLITYCYWRLAMFKGEVDTWLPPSTTLGTALLDPDWTILPYLAVHCMQQDMDRETGLVPDDVIDAIAGSAKLVDGSGRDVPRQGVRKPYYHWEFPDGKVQVLTSHEVNEIFEALTRFFELGYARRIGVDMAWLG